MLGPDQLDKPITSGELRLGYLDIPHGANTVIVNHNNGDPGEAVWVCPTANLKRHNVHAIFPNIIQCHIIRASGNAVTAFAHLSPMTSLLRVSTTELAKLWQILTNYEPENLHDWQFTILHLDADNEPKFRARLADVLAPHGTVSMLEMLVKDPIVWDGRNKFIGPDVVEVGGNFYQTRFSGYAGYTNASGLGEYNTGLPIYAIGG